MVRVDGGIEAPLLLPHSRIQWACLCPVASPAVLAPPPPSGGLLALYGAEPDRNGTLGGTFVF